MILSKPNIIVITIILIHIFSIPAHSYDREYEKKISNTLVQKNEVTDLFWINTRNSTFLSLLKVSPNDKNKGVAIILHSIGGHADWPDVISPIRNRLPEHDLSTLSIQLPIISPSKNIEEYGMVFQESNSRIKAAIKFLQTEGYNKIFLIGHGFGALSSLIYSERENAKYINGMVFISLQNYNYIKPPINLLRLIKKIKIPILDIYGSLDFKEAIDAAPDRRLASKKSGSGKYTQIEINNADHYFQNMEDDLIKNIIHWVDNPL